MTGSALEMLVHDDPIPSLLGENEHWQRSYGRIDGKGTATLLYECQASPLRLAAVRIVDATRRDLFDPGVLSIGSWLSDPALPQMREIVRRRPQIIPVRYRPGKRLTFRLGRTRDLYCKALADHRGAAIHADGQRLWQAAQSGMLDFGVARPVGWLPGQRLLIMQAISAIPVAETIFAANGTSLARRMGAANASLAASELAPPTRYDYCWQLARSRKYARRIGRRIPQAVGLLDRLLANLALVQPGPANRPVHGAPHLHQWLVNAEGLHLVDFDRFGLGDPELDAATFCAEMEFEGASQAQDLADAYREGFQSRFPLDPRLFEAYRLHKHLAKALRLLCAIRLDACERAHVLVRQTAELSEKLG